MKKDKNFTLIELLVVIAILGILVSILVPSLNKARNASKQAVCMSRIKQLSTVMMLYAADNNSYYTSQILSGGGYWTEGLIELGYWGGDRSTTLDKMQDFYGCPVREMKPRIEGDRNSFGINSSISNWVPGVHPVVPMHQFREPSELFSFFEMQVPNVDQDWGWLTVGLRFDEPWYIAPHNRHAIVANADGHVSSYTLQKLFSSKDNNTKWVP
ncbi:MAG: prepilin-type N-terminal cleavage/methylation domain-containing protein [Lentisphaeraceae bacterium]|nr:prepilin-type N-terminal cleavage/methylation domain-containing protein [Lentisphaeraceae bacterium]